MQGVEHAGGAVREGLAAGRGGELGDVAREASVVAVGRTGGGDGAGHRGTALRPVAGVGRERLGGVGVRRRTCACVCASAHTRTRVRTGGSVRTGRGVRARTGCPRPPLDLLHRRPQPLLPTGKTRAISRARPAAFVRSMPKSVVSGRYSASRRQARAYRSMSVPRRSGGATKAGLATIWRRRSAAGEAASKSSRAIRPDSSSTMTLLMWRSLMTMPRACTASTAASTFPYTSSAHATCPASSSGAGFCRASGKRRAKTVLRVVPGRYWRTRKWWPPTSNASCTAGTHSSPASRSSAVRSRSRRATASAPSAASPAYGRASLRTTCSPVRLSRPR